MPDPAFAQLVDAYYESLYRFAASLGANASDAADLVQQTFLIWARKHSALRDGSKAKTWLFTTLYREHTRLRRHDGRARSLEELAERDGEIAAEEIDHAARLDATDLIAALATVDEAFRAPLILYFIEELSYQEIATALDVPIGTVMSRLSRGKAQLRAILNVPRGSDSRAGIPSGRKGCAP